MNRHDIAGAYPIDPYSEDPATILARQPWSGHHRVREALWGYAHYGHFTEIGWIYTAGASGTLAEGGTFVTLKSPVNDYGVIIETKGAKTGQTLRLTPRGDLSAADLRVWRSDAVEQFVRLPDLPRKDGFFTFTLAPGSIHSLSTTRGQQKGAFADIPAAKPFPSPYRDDFEAYAASSRNSGLPRLTADITGVFELATRPDDEGRCLRQAVPRPPISRAPEWQPYTILGDQAWTDYEVSADIRLEPGDSAAVMGRVNHVGTGYGFIPKGHIVQTHDDGRCRLAVVRGKPDKKKAVGDAE